MSCQLFRSFDGTGHFQRLTLFSYKFSLEPLKTFSKKTFFPESTKFSRLYHKVMQLQLIVFFLINYGEIINKIAKIVSNSLKMLYHICLPEKEQLMILLTKKRLVPLRIS